jgi:hypothetical protein
MYIREDVLSFRGEYNCSCVNAQREARHQKELDSKIEQVEEAKEGHVPT